MFGYFANPLLLRQPETVLETASIFSTLVLWDSRAARATPVGPNNHEPMNGPLPALEHEELFPTIYNSVSYSSPFRFSRVFLIRIIFFQSGLSFVLVALQRDVDNRQDSHQGDNWLRHPLGIQPVWSQMPYSNYDSLEWGIHSQQVELMNSY